MTHENHHEHSTTTETTKKFRRNTSGRHNGSTVARNAWRIARTIPWLPLGQHIFLIEEPEDESSEMPAATVLGGLTPHRSREPLPRKIRTIRDAQLWIQQNWPDFKLDETPDIHWRGRKQVLLAEQDFAACRDRATRIAAFRSRMQCQRRIIARAGSPAAKNHFGRMHLLNAVVGNVIQPTVQACRIETQIT